MDTKAVDEPNEPNNKDRAAQRRQAAVVMGRKVCRDKSKGSSRIKRWGQKSWTNREWW